MANGHGNGWKSIIITALLSIVLTGGGAWFTWGRQSMSRTEVAEMIRTQDPYIADRQTVQQLISDVRELRQTVNNQGQQLAQTVAILERVERRIEQRYTSAR